MSDRVVIVTGASSGIGAALARVLAKQDDVAVLVARRRDALDAVAANAGPKCHPIVADMTRREDARRVAEEAISRFGHVDVWVNNVGRGITRAPSQLTDADVDDMMRVNVLSALYGMQEILPHFKARGAGHIINVSSMLGRMPHAVFRSAYNGAKHFLNALTANIRAEIAETHPGIQVSLVSPGVVSTEFGRNALHGGPDSRELPNPQPPEEVATVIAAVIESRAPDGYTRPGSHQRVVDYFSTLGRDP